MKENMFESARISPLGDRAIVVRFANDLALAPNKKARELQRLVVEKLGKLIEAHSGNLVSCVFHYDPLRVSYDHLRQEIALLVSNLPDGVEENDAITHSVKIAYDLSPNGGLSEICKTLKISVDEFIKYHTSETLTALALGFSPGFLYLGLHKPPYVVPRRAEVQDGVPAGAVLFAAGQTAITSRSIRTGWHVIGHTDLRNFNPEKQDPIIVNPGDRVNFQAVEGL
jgi:KipI family sensor histidine kinase inhibitor